MSKTITIAVLLVFALGAAYIYTNRPETGGTNDVSVSYAGFGAGQKAVIYKDPNCGCCVGYAEEMKKQGFDVEIVPTENMGEIKERYGIPQDRQSCHTVALGDKYFIEGHVPMEAVEKLLSEQPEIAGIGLSRMPSGSPGMPGPKRAPYEVYQASNGGEFSEFLTI